MAKLTEKQAEVIRRMLAGEPLQYHDGFRSNGYYTFGKAPNWQNLKGYAGSINGLRDRKIIKYQKAVGLWGQDLVFVDEAQARDMLTAYDGGRAAIAATAVAAQPVSVATDAAPAFTPIEAQGWHHLIDPRVMIELPADSPFIEQLTDRRIDAWFAEPSSHTQYVVWKFDENEYQIGIRYDEPTDEKLTAFKAWVLAQHSAPAPDAAQTAAADAEAWGEPTPVRDIDIEIDDLPQINMPIVPASALAVGAARFHEVRKEVRSPDLQHAQSEPAKVDRNECSVSAKLRIVETPQGV